MSSDFEKRSIADFGLKLAHLEGILGAYLPRRVFDSVVQQQAIDTNKSSFSRLSSGQRKAANWELGRFIEMFELAQHGFDYRLFHEPFDSFVAALQSAGVGSYGATAACRLREALRRAVAPGAEIGLHRDRQLNVGGIGGEEEIGVMTLTRRDRVSLTVPLQPSATASSFLMLLHDFPAGRATSCLMPSHFAPDHVIATTSRQSSLRLPFAKSGYLSFPVAGESGYRCLYGIQSATDLAAYVGLEGAAERVVDITGPQIVLLVDFLENASAQLKAGTHVSFAEYLMK
jgi:hypothetical protein